MARYENPIDDRMCTDIPDNPCVRSSYDSDVGPSDIDDFYKDDSPSADHQDYSDGVDIWMDMQSCHNMTASTKERNGHNKKKPIISF